MYLEKLTFDYFREFAREKGFNRRVTHNYDAPNRRNKVKTEITYSAD